MKNNVMGSEEEVTVFLPSGSEALHRHINSLIFAKFCCQMVVIKHPKLTLPFYTDEEEDSFLTPALEK